MRRRRKAQQQQQGAPTIRTDTPTSTPNQYTYLRQHSPSQWIEELRGDIVSYDGGLGPAPR